MPIINDVEGGSAMEIPSVTTDVEMEEGNFYLKFIIL